ncbi:GNAT family N-acetyltransferase [Sphingobium aromaticiconvertens]|uniref:GNAT family N-acetyltransferase n=1 Tax=Sphingobium aromaticiconvertens TaxID=365341 RepID=UPI00301770AC
MRHADLPAIAAISDTVHQSYSEDMAIYAERLDLYPSGCFTLWRGNRIGGYLISHPWHRHSPPALNAMLDSIPAMAGTYYLHDIALLPDARGSGAGRAAVDLIIDLARKAGFQDVMLMAVNGADRFWASVGFTYVDDADPAAQPGGYGAGTHHMRRVIEG